ncbi:ABC transporter ATP-binding protein [Suttonella sp. R2A3]|uniref:ABC transporter ATP-binding protein n=1 Tax=Suttonella sp. R2A3 TaxID=2908648 RepID=UPI001F165753|nr:ABC transporter ATP-binding protein [Suttonella sp. R2A3]UJF24553.1 ABC transporter ATP-binding protein [Suttonella sp. R2A3]
MAEAVVRLDHVRFQRGQRVIFDDVSLEIPAGEIVAIMGPSGTGKTTMLKLITGQLRPQSGEVYTLGQPVHRLNAAKLRALREDVSMLFQSGALFTDMSVGDNVAFVLREKTHLDPALIDVVVDLKLQRVGLRGAKNLMPSELSGGMSRRAALARAIVRDPRLMIYDEPFTGQDPITLGMLTRLIRDLNDGLGMTSLVVSHDIAEVASIADRIILIANQRVIAYDTPQALYASDDPLVHQFMHAESDGPVAFHYPAEDYVSGLLKEDV